MNESINNNAAVLSMEMEWLRQLVDLRLRLFFNDHPPYPSIWELPVPDQKPPGAYAETLVKYCIELPERIILALALANHLQPELLDGFLAKNTTYDKRFSEFGGATGNNTTFNPTCQTALFLLAGSDVAARLSHYPLLCAGSTLLKNKIVVLDPVSKDQPFAHSRLLVAEDYVHYFITGEMNKPHFNDAFPAKLVTTALEWKDAVLPHHTLEGIAEIKDWIEHGGDLLNRDTLGKRLKPGYKSLFYGPPGTGKTLTASLLGKSTGHDVYKIDLSMVVSKYIGETEKNLGRVFDMAQNRRWILIFDEADSLFGKRSEVSGAVVPLARSSATWISGCASLPM